jgi:hypothetical protein
MRKVDDAPAVNIKAIGPKFGYQHFNVRAQKIQFFYNYIYFYIMIM